MNEDSVIKLIKEKALNFRDARNWKQFHTVKNLSAGLSVEASELQELFLWKNDNEINVFVDSGEGNKRIREELADVFVYLLYLADACNVDLIDAAYKKIEINNQKYPVEKSFNNSKKYTEL